MIRLGPYELVREIAVGPEQAWGQELDGRSDIFSTGIVLYEMLTGRPIYAEQDPLELVDLARACVITPPSKLRPDIPPRLEKIVLRALAADRADRYQHADELVSELQEFLRVNSPRFGGASLAALVERLFARAPTLAPSSEPMGIEDISVRRLADDELVHAGDTFFDQNSMLLPGGESSLDSNNSLGLGDDTIFDQNSVAVVVDTNAHADSLTQHEAGPSEASSKQYGFAKLDVHERLGWSVLATVHRATLSTQTSTHTTDRDVALKRLAPQLADDELFAERFVSEMTRVLRVEHQNLVEIFDFGCIDRVHYVATELATGVTLRKLLLRSQPAPIPIVLAILSQLLDALVAAHRCAVHGSVTPGNVIILSDGVVKLTDLGIARALWGVAPHPIVKLGYIAPEVALGAVMDARADVFAVGVIAWELLAGRRLFDGSTARAILQQLRTLRIDPPSRYNQQCDAALDRIVLAALMRHSDRTPSAAAMRAALHPFTEQLGGKLDDVRVWAHGPAERLIPDLEFKLSVEDPPALDIDANRRDLKPANDDVHDESMVIVIESNES